MKHWQAALISTSMAAFLAFSLWVRSQLTIDPLWGFIGDPNPWMRLYAVLQLIAVTILLIVLYLMVRWIRINERKVP